MSRASEFVRAGLVIVPDLLSEADMSAGVAELSLLYPTAEGFHSASDPRRARYVGNEFAGIDTFPLKSVELNLLCVHPNVVGLARELLADNDLRIYSAEAWAKYTGAADYEQVLHSDFLNHTLMVPSADPAFDQVEMFIHLSDVTAELGAPCFVSVEHTRDLPLLPNWRSRFVIPEQYQAEIQAVGPAGTAVAYSTRTLHRGAQLTAPGGARFTLHVSYRRAANAWADRVPWTAKSYDQEWIDFVARASVQQLCLFGFPPPGHRYWTQQTLRDTALRYPGFDPTVWRTQADAN